MLIDGFTVVAQIINFLILLFLLRRFLYGPILKIMEERQEKIAAQLAEAQNLKDTAEAEGAQYREERQALHKQREHLLAEVKSDAEEHRKELLSKARREVEAARTNWQKGVIAEKEAFIQTMRREIGKQVYGVSRRALADLADVTLEQQVLQVFRKRIQALDADARKTLLAELEKAQQPLLVQSAFEIPSDTQKTFIRDLQSAIGRKAEVVFEVDPDLLCGVELHLQDYKLAWTVADYIDDLEASLFASLDEADVEHAHAEG